MVYQSFNPSLAEKIKMPCPHNYQPIRLLDVGFWSKFFYLMTNSADLDLHCLLRQGMLCSAREGLKNKKRLEAIFLIFILTLCILCILH